MAKRRLTALRFPNDVVRDVSRLVELHLRFHGYGEGEWTDSAVRRYVRDAGPLLPRLHVLTRADCTTRNRAKAARLARAYDGLEQRIAELSEQEELGRIRPELDGNDIMRILGCRRARWSGRPTTSCSSCGSTKGELGRERVTQELLRWAAAEGIGPARLGAGRGRTCRRAASQYSGREDRVAGRHHADDDRRVAVGRHEGRAQRGAGHVRRR